MTFSIRLSYHVCEEEKRGTEANIKPFGAATSKESTKTSIQKMRRSIFGFNPWRLSGQKPSWVGISLPCMCDDRADEQLLRVQILLSLFPCVCVHHMEWSKIGWIWSIDAWKRLFWLWLSTAHGLHTPFDFPFADSATCILLFHQHLI